MMETKLPSILPVFSMSGLVLLPRARLPLNIVEPRYISLVDAALGQGRMIGLVQSTSGEDTNPAAPFYQVGCAGRISSFSETDDGRYLISLNGVCRFLSFARKSCPCWTVIAALFRIGKIFKVI